MTRFLHVANGTSTTMTLGAAGVPGTLSIWADPLYEGPVPGGISDEALIAVRRRHFGGSVAGADPINDMHAWRRVIADRAYDELVLWFEHDLFDQLNLVQLLSWIRDELGVSLPVSLVCIDAFPGRPHFKGLGELTPAELAPLLATRQPVTDAQYGIGRRAWDAFRAPTPEPLDGLRREDISALPFLARALERFLQEYPWTTDGLARSERRLLELAAERERTLGAAFAPMSDGERAYHMTDLSLLALAETLAGSSPSLLTLTGEAESGRKAFARTVSLTDHGRRVLAGELDRVAACGIDRWFGGVHLEGREVPWRWDPAARAIRPTG
jgi:hypothetical protein